MSAPLDNVGILQLFPEQRKFNDIRFKIGIKIYIYILERGIKESAIGEDGLRE